MRKSIRGFICRGDWKGRRGRCSLLSWFRLMVRPGLINQLFDHQGLATRDEGFILLHNEVTRREEAFCTQDDLLVSLVGAINI